MADLLCLNVKENRVDEVKCQKLDDFYKYLECDCFDIACLKIGEKYFDCFVDDEGLFKEEIIPAAISKDGKVMLVGNIVFANHDSEGNTTSLSEEDIKMIKKNIVTVSIFDKVTNSLLLNRVVFAED